MNVPVGDANGIFIPETKEKIEMRWVRTIAVYNNLPIEIK